jgi:hypothetical protein
LVVHLFHNYHFLSFCTLIIAQKGLFVKGFLKI